MLFLHGVFGNGNNWRTIANHISAECLLTCHLLDARNHGQSPHHPSMTFDDMQADLLRYLSDHQLNSIILLGHSMGGKCAMLFARNYPSLVEKLVVVDIAPVAYSKFSYHLSLIHHLRAIDLKQLKSRRQADEFLKPRIPDSLVRGFLLQNLVDDHTTTNDSVPSWRWRLNLDAIESHLQSIMTEPVNQKDVDNNPKKYTGDVLFIGGTKSEYIQPDIHWPIILRLFPNAELKMIEGAGHNVHYEKPKEFISVLKPFLMKDRTKS
jgi:esterase